jgi:hypothetical protein
MVKASTRKMPHLVAKLSMSAAAEKPMDGETSSVFFYFVNASYYSLLLLLSFSLKACNVPSSS